jgi:signal transduction histidine kinase
MSLRLRSLQLRLAVRLAALFIAGSVAIAGFLVLRAYDTADSLGERELSLRAGDLASYVTVGPDGRAQLALPQVLRDAYDDPSNVDVFAIRQGDGRILAAVPPALGQLIQGWPAATEHASYFHLAGIAGNAQNYYGLGLSIDSVAGPLSIWVARAAGANALVHSFLEEFVFDIAWVIPLFMLLTLGIAVLAIRSAVKPILRISDVASSIGPGSTSIRLPQEDLPSEVAPLVSAVNRALDRLEQGFVVQREFTANAAHELRTPLAIVTGALDGLEPSAEVDKLKADVARMNRLVGQLLSVARLDAVALDVSNAVDLNDAARDIVGSLAPWAVAQSRTIAFVGPDNPVIVTGNAYAIADAIRNLVENAVSHSPPQGEVSVEVHADARICVADDGPGVADEDRERIFERFWRGKAAHSHGAGLGLAIVAEIMKAHGGNVRVEARPNRGAVFTLVFRPTH